MESKANKIAEEIFQRHNGILRTRQALELGINRPTLSRMVKAGILVRESRGLYRLTAQQPLSNPDLTMVALRVPSAVFCLISALNYHNLTTQIPYQVYIALPRDTKAPKLDYPPINITYFSEAPYSAGIEEHTLDGISVRIYCREKTIADCFKFRNKIGQDVAIEALKDYLHQAGRDVHKLLEYAAIDRVSKIILPYLKGSL
jgi:predicted transcriptional regulator of viral defense system